MNGRFGTRSCSYCGREFEPIRRDQHLCKRECHDQWLTDERRRALAFWRQQKRYQQMIDVDGDEAEVA
jgi:predicted nucleic acid-binding Zn ribbon protein